ncbi:MAG: RtcB family protein [Taibaiella sp.]|nr:RtcB family protein [Taibaiella sp.]
MQSIGFYCDADSIEANAMHQLQQYAQKPHLQKICAFTDIHYCSEKALPVGVAFETKDYCYPLITGKDIGCGVMYLKVNKAYWRKPFHKKEHYKALVFAHQKMTNDGLGGGNHFLSIEEDDEDVYIICHTGTRDRGIALYQHCMSLCRDFSQEYGSEVDFIHKDFLKESFRDYYQQTLDFGYQRRKNFCIKTLLFLQKAHYILCDKNSIDKDYLKQDYSKMLHTGYLNGTPFELSDSMHNHLKFEAESIMHRKGSTELIPGNTAVIPLSMSRGSLLVKAADSTATTAALNSCAHGAGRRLSRYDAMKHWKTTLKQKQRKAYIERFPELLDHSGRFPSGYIQEFDFAYKDSQDIFAFQPYLKLVAQTSPVATIKYTEI